jgi:hypothetical protein
MSRSSGLPRQLSSAESIHMGNVKIQQRPFASISQVAQQRSKTLILVYPGLPPGISAARSGTPSQASSLGSRFKTGFHPRLRPWDCLEMLRQAATHFPAVFLICGARLAHHPKISLQFLSGSCFATNKYLAPYSCK